MKRLLLLILLALYVMTVPLAGLRYLWAVFTATDRAWTMALAYDHFLNTGTNGQIRESISSRAGKAQLENKRWACVLCRWLARIDPDHCRKSIGT